MGLRPFIRLPGLTLTTLVSVWLLLPTSLSAQSQAVSPGLSARLGAERSAGQDGGATALAPLTLDASVRLWTDEATRLAYGGSFRVELGGSGSVGIVPRVELRHMLGDFELRPGVALPFYFAPKTLLGPELSAGIRYPIAAGFGLIADLAITAYVVGNNLPEGSTLLQITGGVGVDLRL